jgi:hypothetical protein
MRPLFIGAFMQTHNLNRFTYNNSRGNNTRYSSWEMVTHNNKPLFEVIGKFSLSFLNKCCYCDVLNIFLSCNREPNAIESSTLSPPIWSKGTQQNLNCASLFEAVRRRGFAIYSIHLFAVCFISCWVVWGLVWVWFDLIRRPCYWLRLVVE